MMEKKKQRGTNAIGDRMKDKEKIQINMPLSEAVEHPRFYEGFHGRIGQVHKIWDFSGAAFGPRKGDRISVEIKLDDKGQQHVHIPISYCQRINK